MTTHYGIWHNVDAHYVRGYQDGDRIIQGHTGSIPDPAGGDALHACEAVFFLHNMDDRPDGQDAPSLSVGDVVSVSVGPEHVWEAWTVESLGWSRVDLEHAVKLDGPWRETIKAVEP